MLKRGQAMNRTGLQALVLAVSIAALTARAACGESEEAKENPRLAPGLRLRFAVLGQAAPVEGTLFSSEGASVVIEPGDAHPRLVVPWETVEAVDVRHRSTRTGLLAGVLAGGAGFAVLALAGDDGVASGAVFGGALALPASAVAVAVAHGKRPALKGALAGALVSGVLLGALGHAVCSDFGNTVTVFGGGTGGTSSCDTAAILLGAGLGAVSGAAAGHVARDRWEPLWKRGVRVGVGPVRGRGVTVTVRVAF